MNQHRPRSNTKNFFPITFYLFIHSAYLVCITKSVTGALRGSWECAQDKFTYLDVKLTINGRPGGSGTSTKSKKKKNFIREEKNDSFINCVTQFIQTHAKIW